jgi:hypothetical protein
MIPDSYKFPLMVTCPERTIVIDNKEVPIDSNWNALIEENNCVHHKITNEEKDALMGLEKLGLIKYQFFPDLQIQYEDGCIFQTKRATCP